MSDIKWIKITTDIFDDEKIKIIEDLPDGDTILIVWLKLLTLAGKKNDSGLIYITRDIPFTIDSLSKIFNRKKEVVSLALNTFITFDMIAIEKDIISIIKWDKHQSTDRLDKIKENSRISSKKYREKQKQLLNETENVMSPVTSRVTSRDHTEKSRVEKNREEESVREPEPAPDGSQDIQGLINHWNKKDLPKFRGTIFNLPNSLELSDRLRLYTNSELIKAIDNYTGALAEKQSAKEFPPRLLFDVFFIKTWKMFLPDVYESNTVIDEDKLRRELLELYGDV